MIGPKNVTSRIHIEKNAPPTGGHVFSPIWTIFELPNKENCPPPAGHVIQLTGTIFKLNSHIKETHFLTKFHENWAKHKNAPPTGGHVFSPIWTIFELVRDINKTNVLINFHDDWAKIVTSRVFTIHVIELTRTNFELYSHIKKTNVLTKFHENWAKNVTSRVFTCFHYIHIEKNASPTGGHVFSPIWTVFELVRDINKTNVLTNFHDDWAKIVTSRVFTRKTAPPTGGHVFQRTGTTFKLNQHIIKSNILTNFELGRDFIGVKLLTKFHEDGTTNVATNSHLSNQMDNKVISVRSHGLTETIFELNSRIKETNVLTKIQKNWAKNVTSIVLTCFHYIHIEKNAPPTGGHVFSPIRTIVELVQDINKTNVLTNFHDDWAKIVTSRPNKENFYYIHIKKNAPPSGGPVFSRIWTIFELVRDINKTNVLTTFHDDLTKIVTSRVFTRENCHYIHIKKNAPLTGGHVVLPIWTTFELVRDIN
ncbi:hypothetical protein DPMN_049591 [Dreissena polymorpha]|uniref:Uncharacterized protein n=1 Tax=Dreissena polymorpha TaxID=45954 RepID=A0A9D4CF66_DREPO|nr:hypothetical protein DPMN_049591 [Dreissena polymorpha]